MFPKLMPGNETENKLVADALNYARSGLLVFPLHAVKNGQCTCNKNDCKSPAKHPRTIHGLSQASSDLQFVKNLFSNFTYSSANIAICTGKESNLAVIDVDCGKGATLEELYKFVPKETLEKTLWVKTGKGFHLYFAYPPDAEIRNSADKLGNFIDVRGNGGYVVAPPSMHITGKAYEFLNDNDILPMPQAFIEKLSRSEAKAESRKQNDNPPEFFFDGKRNDSLARQAGKLRRAGLSQSELETSLLKINSERCKPPLEANEVVKIARSIARYDVGQEPPIDFDAVKDAADFSSLFVRKSANAWMEQAKLKPIPKMLFDEFWFENEVCILFGDTGKGKTILAVQIADAISRNAAIGNFRLEAEKQKILYFDFELSEKQFEKRYSVEQGDIYTNHFLFDENFQRIEINRFCDVPKRFTDFESYLFFSLEYEIAVSGAKVLIVDNITYLKSETEKAKDALPLMKQLIKLKMKYGVSIMALAHTPKRDLSKAITINDLQGSKMLSNFCDNIFAVGESAKDKNLRYLKQIKPRNTEILYDAENVAVCQITKPDNFLKFEFLGYGSESEHLKQMTESDKSELVEKVKNLSALGKNQRTIAEDLGISPASVNRYLKK